MSKQIIIDSLAVFKYYYNGEGYFPAIPLYVSAAGNKKLYSNSNSFFCGR